MNNNIVSIQTQNLSTISTVKSVFKDGESVFVKILNDNHNGTYTGCVGGNRVTIYSSKEMVAGSSFLANITAKDGTIFITPKDASILSDVTNSIKIIEVQGDALRQLLCDLAMPVNLLSENLLKMMMQLKMRIDGTLLRNFYMLCQKHKGKEKLSGELLLLLKDKGIDISDEELERLLDYLSSNPDSYENNDNDSNKENKPSDIINKINKVKNGWSLIPFKIEENESFVIGAGVIRILIDKASKLNMINLNCYFKEKEYLFSLKFEKEVLSSVDFCVYPKTKDKDIYVELLRNIINDDNVNVYWTPSSKIEGCASENEIIRSFYGEA